MNPGPHRASAAADDVAVAARGLRLTHGGLVAFERSDVCIPAGTATAVIGPNGSGKSTFLNAVAGLHPPAAGSLTVLGRSPADAQREAAYVLQVPATGNGLPITVREVVTMGRFARRGAFGRLRLEDREAVSAALARLEIADLADRDVRDLSGGQRQRVLVAQGLAQSAPLLLLDEPVTGLDLPSQRTILSVLGSERAAGRTVIYATHDLDDARRADQVLLLAGRVVAAGPPDAVLTPAQLGAAYVGRMVDVDGQPALDDAHRHGGNDVVNR